MAHGYEISEITVPTGLEMLFNGKSPKLWGLGELAILKRKLLGIISARQFDSDLVVKSAQLLEELALLSELACIGGWHSPSEKEAFRILMARTVPIVFCVAKGLGRIVLSGGLEDRVNQGQMLLLTHCSPKAKRISRDASIRRNKLVEGLAGALLVLSAPSGSASLDLARLALCKGKPVFTPEHRMNSDLLARGALPATFENVRAALG